ncbi:MAG: PAS domain-containing protein [Geobacteraceae bacterium]|nr:PAS domain-containing protein [Geobacteraceae bacterium]
MGSDNDRDQAAAAAALRRRAEARSCAERVDQQPPRTESDAQRLVHELEVHQIELEMQNEELHLAQEKLEVSRNTYAELYNFAPVGYFIFDAQGVIREANLTGAQLLGIDRGLLIDRRFADFIADAEGRGIYSEHLAAVLHRQVIQRCELRLTGKDDTVVHGLMQSVTVDTIKSRDGCILSSIVDGTVGKQLADDLQKAHDNLEAIVQERTGELTRANTRLSQQIEERKRTEDALYEAQQVFRVLVENSPDIIARYDRECRRTYVNPTYLKVAKIPRQDLLATAPMELSPLPADSATDLQNLLRRVLDSGVAEAIDAVWSMSDNIDHWYNICAFPEFDRDGRVVSVMTISRDITERKQAEATILQLNEDLEQRVRERTTELERRNRELEQMNKAFVGRELKMVELKERIRELEKGAA